MNNTQPVKLFGKRSIKMLALMVAGSLISSAAFPAVGIETTITSYAAELPIRNANGKISIWSLPVGTIIYSDSFPGFYITFNGQNSYVIKAGDNNVSLNIRVTDSKLAAQSVAALKWIFGVAVTDLTKGSVLSTTAKMNGLVKGEEKIFYQEALTAGIHDEMRQILPAENPLEFKTDSPRTLIKALVEAFRQEEEKEELIEEVEPGGEIIIHVKKDKDTDKDKKTDPNKKTEQDKKPEQVKKPVVIVVPTTADENNNHQNEDYDDDDDDWPDPEPEIKPQPPQPDPEIKYDEERVIMLYLDGCDIESSFAQSTMNLLEILTAGVPDDTRFFIASGGTLKWFMEAELIYQSYAQRVLYPAKRGELSPDEKEKVNAMAKDLYSKYKTKLSGMQYWEVVKQDGTYQLEKKKDVEGYMTDPNQLTDFIDYCTDNTFAKNYDLILYDHGLGLLGYGNDDLLKKYYAENPKVPQDIPVTYTIKALSDAIGLTDFAMSGNKLELLCFDACKMANYEVANQFTPYANYFIASEEIAPGAGWNYYDVLMKLQQDSTIGSEDLAKEFVNDYILKHTRFAGDDITIRTLLSASNLNSMEFLDDALSELYDTLLKNIRDKKAYFDIAGAIGKVGNFGALAGYNPSDEFDLKLFCEALLLDDYPDIKEKSQNVLKLLDETVVISKQMYYDAGTDFGGLYLYFPANAYNRAFTKYRNGSSLEFLADGVSDNLKSLNEIDANESYKKLITLFAFIKASGNEIGKDWYTGRIGDYKSLFEALSGNNTYKIVADAVKSDPELEAMAKTVVEKQLEERIRTDDVAINKGNVKVSEGGNTSVVPSEDQAIVEVPKSDIFMASGDRADIRVTAKLDDGTYLMGRSSLYSEEPVEGTKNPQGKEVIYWNINKFDNKWYTVNDQLSSFFVTEVKDKDNYSGYIPVALWFEKDTVNGPDDKSRDEYLQDTLREGKNIGTYVLNVEAENGQLQIYSITKYSGGNFGDTFDVSQLKDSYLEILGGFDSLVFESMQSLSLGTIYTEEGFFDLEKRYVEGLTPEYILTDAYGTDYVLNNENLEGKGLDNFVKEIPADQQANVFTWTESKQNAAQIRQQAKEEAAAAKKDEEGVEPIIEYVEPIVVPAKTGANPVMYQVVVLNGAEETAQEPVDVQKAGENVDAPSEAQAAGENVDAPTDTQVVGDEKGAAEVAGNTDVVAPVADVVAAEEIQNEGIAADAGIDECNQSEETLEGATSVQSASTEAKEQSATGEDAAIVTRASTGKVANENVVDESANEGTSGTSTDEEAAGTGINEVDAASTDDDSVTEQEADSAEASDETDNTTASEVGEPANTSEPEGTDETPREP